MEPPLISRCLNKLTMKILVVDDEQDNKTLFEQRFQKGNIEWQGGIYFFVFWI